MGTRGRLDDDCFSRFDAAFASLVGEDSAAAPEAAPDEDALFKPSVETEPSEETAFPASIDGATGNDAGFRRVAGAASIDDSPFRQSLQAIPFDEPVFTPPPAPAPTFAEFDAAFERLDQILASAAPVSSSGTALFDTFTAEPVAPTPAAPPPTPAASAPVPPRVTVVPAPAPDVAVAPPLVFAPAPPLVPEVIPAAAAPVVATAPPAATAPPVAAAAPAPAPAPAPGPAPGPTPEPRPAPAVARPAVPRAIVAATRALPPLWRPRPHETTSLEKLLGTLDNLALIREAIAQPNALDAEGVSSEAFKQVFAQAGEVCREFHLETARVRADFAIGALESGHIERLASEISELIRHMRHDVLTCTVSPIAADRVWAFKLTLGEKAAAAFPSAEPEIAEGGRCFGAGRYTACTFHMLRAGEHALCALAYAADAKRAAAVPTVDWATAIAAVETRLAAVEKSRGDSEKAATRAFFHDALRDLRVLSDSARKLAMPGSAFDETQALTTCQTVRNFLVRLSERITEESRQTLTKVDFVAAPAAAAAPPETAEPAMRLERGRRKVVGLDGDDYEIAADKKR